ncbi:R-spondin-1 [Kryptolebias marmoratus]|uniref:R-spondin 1 n=1 Tax=Kryptolebias marmoratus TaxID=37003 RepID=A0A3Q3BKL7_KRYMA|nr:R-spondin-1 [Kryptolebias marmoratus]XP_037836498.1 R-spondin-1 [Kryptolebias marmoratus]XP_037836500.1 R-spondin-1 [Kryptolebias marmoratus]
MQLGLVVLAMIFLSSMGHSDVLKLSKARRQRRVSTEGSSPCLNTCEQCSEYNGCIKCKPRLFIFLERSDIRQIGVCLASCPMGYFGMRNPGGNNHCTQCKIDNCEACFNHNFCTKCKEGLYSHSGRCYVSCPPGQHTANETMECVGQRASECELGEWSQWSSCMKKNKTCGFKRGSQSRVRLPLPQIHSADNTPSLVPSQTCVPETERRKCVVTKKPCVRERKKKGHTQDDTNRGENENARGRGREGRGEGGGGGGGGGGRRKKGQIRTTTAPSITTSAVT